MKNIDELIDYIETFQNEKNWSNEIWLIKCAAIRLKDKSKGQTLPIDSVIKCSHNYKSTGFMSVYEECTKCGKLNNTIR
jgi:hypothetical protein